MSSRTTRGGALLAAAALSLAALLAAPLAANAASIQDGSSVWLGAHQGYGGTGLASVYSETPVDTSNPGAPDYWAYCIEHNVSARTNTSGVTGPASGYLGSNYFTNPAIQSKVLWVLAHSYPALSLGDFAAASGVSGISANDAIEATQYAIWRYTDLTFDANWAWSTDDSKNAYWYLVNGANASSGMTPTDFAVTATITGPATAQTADSLVGPFTVGTDRPSVAVSVAPAVPLVDAGGTAIDPNAVTDGQQLYLDLRGSSAAGSATVTVTANGTSATGKVVSVPKTDGATPTVDSHAQSLILVTPSTTKTTAQASVLWRTTAVSIGTTLLDAADQDHVLAWNGGALTDTVAYQNLVPGTTYTASGELVRKSDGSATGITGTTTFTPTTADGTVDVSFTVPAGYAGQTLVAFEDLFTGSASEGSPVASHKDLDDAAQTITVSAAPATAPAPATGGTLAATGGTAPLILGAVALLIVVTGAALLAIRRRADA